MKRVQFNRRKPLAPKTTAAAITLCIGLLLAGCSSCGGKKPPTVTPKPVAKQIGNINFFLETSASMEGYLRGNSDLAKVIPNFLVDVENRVTSKNKTIRINYISDSIAKYAKDTRSFIHDISTTKVATGKSSQMHRVFEAVTNATDSNDISILVSDCILSYSDADIKANKEINVQKADGELKAFVKDAFLKMKARNVCATVYGFSSKFYGNYYTYQNTKLPLNGAERPYYIWVIGHKELVQQFNKQLAEIANFKPELSISFGMFNQPIDAYSLLFKTGHEGDWAYDNNHLKDVAPTKKQPVKFSLAVDFSTLPPYAMDLAYLKANLKLQGSDLQAKLLDVKKASEIDISKAAPKERAPLQDATHVINIEISDLYQPKGTISLQLPLQYDMGYKNWSVMDDKNIGAIGKKTFAFEHLVDGVREAYQNNNEYYINILINVKK
jgi:hypothetical protein